MKNKSISNWLFFCAFTVLMMIVIGGITRLTESGLSIVEWKPVTGAVPPMNEAAWQSEFDLYQQSPQYQQVNHGMTLSEFKNIYFWEWIHRLWGRLIGLFYALPLLYFWRFIPSADRLKFFGILGLGALQGAMGWYMVKSGLVDMPAVSHYRLAAHFMLAVLIYGCLFRLGLKYRMAPEPDAAVCAPLRGFTRACVGAVALTMIWGAFVAGLDAGMVYNTFPKMDAHWVPPEMFFAKPLWLNFFNEPATVQFTHRVLAILTFIKIMALVLKSRRFEVPPRLQRLFEGLVVMAVLQVGLGITTLLTQVHLHVAVAHQAGAVILLTLLLWILHDIPIVKGEK